MMFLNSPPRRGRFQRGFSRQGFPLRGKTAVAVHPLFDLPLMVINYLTLQIGDRSTSFNVIPMKIGFQRTLIFIFWGAGGNRHGRL